MSARFHRQSETSHSRTAKDGVAGRSEPAPIVRPIAGFLDVTPSARYPLARVSIIIPAYNEAGNLRYVLPALPDWVHEVIVVNDHSTDDTAAAAIGALPHVRVINNDQGRGKGAALRTGFAAATGDILIAMDADGSSNPHHLSRFVDALLDGAWLVRGSRFIGDGGSTDFTYIRQLGCRGLCGIASLLFGGRFTDLFCGYYGLWKDCLDYFVIDCDGFDVEALIHLRACKANLEATEVPSFEYQRIHGISHFHTFRDGWRVLHMIVREWRNGRSVVERVKKPLGSGRTFTRRPVVAAQLPEPTSVTSDGPALAAM